MKRIERENVTVPVIIQMVGGDLRVRGRNGSSLVAEGDGLQVEQIGEGQPYLIRSDGDCRLNVPSNINIIAQQVGGDAKLTDIGGTTEIKAVGGDLTLRGIHSAHIKAVGGDLRLKWAEADVSVQAVGADATIREVCGDVSVDSIGSDLYIRNIEGRCVVENVGADLLLSMDFLPDQEYRFGAQGDILCRIQPDTNARFIVPGDIPVRLDIEASILQNENEQIVTVGEGSATVIIHHGESFRLVSEEEDYVLDLGIQIEEEMEARLSTLEERISQQLEGLDERIQAKTEQFASQAERFAERAQRQAQRAAERIRKNTERQQTKSKRSGHGARIEFGKGVPSIEFGWGHTPPSPPTPPKAPSEPISEQERLLILKMVQENKISIEEAERLLSALDS
jgi:hypothetical protein